MKEYISQEVLNPAYARIYKDVFGEAIGENLLGKQ